MRNLHKLDQYRDTGPFVLAHFGNVGNHESGRFILPGLSEQLCVLAAAGDGWDHISVSCRARTPTWEEMEHVKRLFFKPGETAMQLHVPVEQHINNNPHVLHMWRPHRLKIPLPPMVMV